MLVSASSIPIVIGAFHWSSIMAHSQWIIFRWWKSFWTDCEFMHMRTTDVYRSETGRHRRAHAGAIAVVAQRGGEYQIASRECHAQTQGVSIESFPMYRSKPVLQEQA